MFWTWTDKAVGKHRRRRGRYQGALFHFRRRQEVVMGGLMLVVVTCVVCGTVLGRSVYRLLGRGSAYE